MRGIICYFVVECFGRPITVCWWTDWRFSLWLITASLTPSVIQGQNGFFPTSNFERRTRTKAKLVSNGNQAGVASVSSRGC